MNDYIAINRAAYDQLADDYFYRLTKNYGNYRHISEKICEYILDYPTVEEKYNSGNKICILELGCGPGGILNVLKNYANVDVYAVDISENMIKFAQISNSDAKIVNANVLDIQDINKLFQEDKELRFDVIIMSAFIHLFPKKDEAKILKKIKSWLTSSGIIYLDTTIEEKTIDGTIMIKQETDLIHIVYLRTLWTKEKFTELICEQGYEICECNEYDSKSSGKRWMRILCKVI